MARTALTARLVLVAALALVLSFVPSANAAIGTSKNLLQLNSGTFHKHVTRSDKLSVVAFTAPVRLASLPSSSPLLLLTAPPLPPRLAR